MTTLSNQQLMLLQMLLELNGEYANKAGVESGSVTSVDNLYTGKTIGDLVGVYSDENLRMLEKRSSKDTEIQCSEMAAIIRQIRNDPELMGLTFVKERDGKMYCFTDTSGNAIVTFRGTSGEYEWKDNFNSLGETDTPFQQEALDFVNSLEGYDDITVVGHSKGGNKAMYCAILSDKVARCVSLDGQGFSREFMVKYAAEIGKNADKITTISLDSDFVHILMYAIPGIKQNIIIESAPDVKGARNHVPGTLFHYEVNSNGEWVIPEENGEPKLFPGIENPGMTYLNLFTVFIMNVCTEEELKSLGDYMGIIAASVLAGGELPENMTLEQFIFSRPDDLAMLLALLMRFMETYNVSEDAMMGLLRAFGLDKILIGAQAAITVAVPGAVKGELTAVGILMLLYANITDGDRDPVIEHILDFLGKWLEEKFNIKASDLWNNIEEKYTDIGHVDPGTMRPDSINNTFKVFDYSENMYQKLTGTMSRIKNATGDQVSGWYGNYGSEEWYDSLLISDLVNLINGYAQGIEGVNIDCRNQADRIFEKVRETDRKYAEKLREINEQLHQTAVLVQETAGKISV